MAPGGPSAAVDPGDPMVAVSLGRGQDRLPQGGDVGAEARGKARVGSGEQEGGPGPGSCRPGSLCHEMPASRDLRGDWSES